MQPLSKRGEENVLYSLISQGIVFDAPYMFGRIERNLNMEFIDMFLKEFILDTQYEQNIM